MADDGMLMNFALDDGPVLPKQSFQGGRWKDRLAAKKVAKHRVTRVGAPAGSKSTRDIFRGGDNGAGEEYIGPSRAPKRQRTDAEFRSEGNANRTAIGPRNTYTADVERPQNNNRNGRTREDDANRPAVISGKLPPGSISIGGGAGKKMKFGDEEATAAPMPDKTPRIITNGRTAADDTSRPAIISGKLPAGSIGGSGAGKKTTFGDEDEEVMAPRPVIKTAPGVGGVALNRDGTKGVISSLFTYNPSSKTTFEEAEEEAEPAKATNAPLTEEMETFTNLGLSRRLAAHLSNKLDMKAPTAIQKAAIPQMVSDDSDAFIQAQTGSGKTLAYLLPIVQRIIAMSVTDDTTTKNVQVHRTSGLFAIVLAPTRELCKQIAGVLERLLRCAPWLVGTTVMGGESKQSEKARLRKGVNILIATPGRLADHLDNTEVLNVSTVRWLILDEGDRLMELGFEEEIKGIVEKIGRRSLAVDDKYLAQALPSRRITVLCSATMKMNVQRLGEISLKDAVHIMADPAEEEASKNADGTDADDKVFSAPAQLKQAYAIVPAKLRLVTLTAILKRAFARRGSVMKVIVFISCADSVDFHFSLFSRPSAISAEEAEKPTLPTSELTKETIAHGTAISTNTNPVLLHRLHGSLAQNIRTATLKAFTESPDPCVLICTDVASRGLDLPNVDYVIEYDPPFSADDHLHRVGRTARAGRDGRALIFLLPGDEEEYVTILASHYRDGKKSLVHNTAEELVRKGFGGTGREWEERATTFQLDVERWTIESPKYLEMARRGFQSHIRAYATHVADERKYFNMQTLHLGHLAKAFALRDKPGSIKVPGLRPKVMTKADRSVAARKAKRGETEKEKEDKVPEGERARKQKKLELDLPTVDEDEAAKRMKRKIREHMASASEFNIG
ncbi:ATP-dependent rna helicase dbp7 [Phlyctema vagabunda]|uniref:ATP-dependent RNA helicase n=1 Tax=Phlyctema vagabunda TaxID=108571 RepID=A0ABR4P5A6_9HELO